MKFCRWVAVMLCMVLAVSVPTVSVQAESSVSAQCYLVMDADTKTVLAEKNAHKQRPMASTTKIMTTLLALEGELDTPFEVDEEALKVEGSSMGLLPGDKVTLRDLAYGMLLPSGNDAANAVAYQMAGSIATFAKWMNNRAKEIGMDNTNFVNPSGLPHDDHYSTAYDMALLACEALENESFSKIASTKKMKLTLGTPPTTRVLENHNQLLTDYEGCIGLKTGFTKAAGRCLVSAAERDGRRLICVTLNAPDDWNDHATLLDEGFARKPKVLWSKKEAVSLPVTGGVKSKVKAYTEKNLSSYLKGEVEVLTQPFCYAPIEKGNVVGKVVLKQSDGSEQSLPLLAGETVRSKNIAAQPQNLWDILCSLFGKTSFAE